MTIRCHCYRITEATFAKAIDDNQAAIEGMPLNKAAAYVFNKVRSDAQAQGSCDAGRAAKCLKPCLGAVRELINEAESVSCQGYHSPSGCAAADVIAGYLNLSK